MKILGWTTKDVYRDQDSPTWSPYRLPEPLLTVWAVEQAQGVIDNGSIGNFYGYDWPEKPSYAVFWEAFRRIGAHESAQCIETTAKLFPFERPERYSGKRWEYMKQSTNRAGEEPDEFDRLGSRFIDLSDSTFQLLAQYILDHADSFPTVIRNRSKGDG